MVFGIVIISSYQIAIALRKVPAPLSSMAEFDIMPRQERDEETAN
jgi:hypothetical protein